MTVRLHYLSSGSARVAFVIRRQEFFIPAAVVFKALLDMSDKELYARVVGTAPGAPVDIFASERVEVLLQELHQMRLQTRADCLAYLGRHFRVARRPHHSAAAHGGSPPRLRRRASSARFTRERRLPDRSPTSPSSLPSAPLCSRTCLLPLPCLTVRIRVQILDQPSSSSDVSVGEELLRQFIFIHLDKNSEKVSLLVLMLQKLFQLVSGNCQGDNPDSMIHQELLLPGLLLQQLVKEKLSEWLERLRDIVKDDAGKRAAPLDDPGVWSRSLPKACNTLDIGRRVEYFLATGNLVSRSGLAMSQTSGFTVVAEKLNYLRYLSHFRSVHRGAYFAELRTTTARATNRRPSDLPAWNVSPEIICVRTCPLPASLRPVLPRHSPESPPPAQVRKLLPESWGFMCPVHTPDGSPCGLLNHLAAACEVVVDPPEDPAATQLALREILAGAGMVPTQPSLALPLGGPQGLLPVMVDGAFAGVVRASIAPDVVTLLRMRKVDKVDASGVIPAHLEAALILPRPGGASPGLFVFTHPSRMVRPVRQLSAARTADCPIELVGALEQAYMAIACPDGTQGGSADLAATHEELAPTAFLSVVASLTPWSDYNQSPRNMYQCQMAKQTMGTPLHSYQFRADTKLYRLQTPQKPISRTQAYNNFGIDDYPLGTMATVAVLSYTGYDLEDAMIINKSALDRGFAHATLIKTETVDVKEGQGRGAAASAKVSRRGRAAQRATNDAEEKASSGSRAGWNGVAPERARAALLLLESPFERSLRPPPFSRLPSTRCRCRCSAPAPPALRPAPEGAPLSPLR